MKEILLTFGDTLKKKRFFVLLDICLLFVPAVLWAQNHPIPVSDINGVVVDDANHGVAGANLRLTAVLDTARVYQTVTNEEGGYSLRVQPGLYTMVVTAVGFKPFSAEVDAKKKVLVDVSLIDDVRQLNEVLVKGRRIRYDAEGYRMNLTQNPQFRQQPVDVIMAYLPGMVVTADRLLLFGRPVARVYVNRRIVRLRGKDLLDYLNTMKGASIKDIQVVASSGAEERASMAGSVVVKIHSVNLTDGGMATVGVAGETGYYSSIRPTVTFQSRQGKLSAYGNASLSYSDVDSKSYGETLFEMSGNRRLDNTKAGNDSRVYNFSVGLGYDFTPKDIVTFEVGALLQDNHSHGRSDITNYSGSTMLGEIADLSWGKNKSDQYQLAADYTHTWKAGEVSTYASYAHDKSTQNKHVWREGNTDMWDSNNQSEQHKKTYTLKVDVTQKLGKNNKLRGGAAFTGWDNDTETDNKQSENGVVNPYMTYSDLFLYKEEIAALYGSYDFSLGKWSASLGLRYEHEHINPRSKLQSDKNYASDYDHLFPNVRLNYVINQKRNHNLRFTYLRGLTTPSMSMLNPAVLWDSEYSYSVGNPYLKPVVFDRLGATLTLFGRLSLDVSWEQQPLFGSHVYKEQDADVMYSSYDDVGETDKWSANVSWSKPITKKWMVSMNLLGALKNEKYLGRSATHFSSFVALLSNNTLPGGFILNTDFQWEPPAKTLETSNGSQIRFTETIRKMFLKNRLSVALAYKYWSYSSRHTYVDGVTQHHHTNYSPHRVNLTVRYTFRWGSMRARVSRGKGVDTEQTGRM